MYLFFLKGNKFQNLTQMEHGFLNFSWIVFEAVKIFL
jgi:hypothetical protein